MSHIPSSAMPHAKPHDLEEEAVPSKPAEPAASDDTAGARTDWGFVAVIAGGVIALGAVAAVAAPLLRGRAAPKRERRERKKAKGKS